jgi:1-acyl-sn-glycerol-3-phosphate acyltransferase
MKKIIAKIILFFLRWKIVITNEAILTNKKYILLAAPHTSAWDFVIGKLVYMSLGIRPFFFIKDDYFKGSIKNFLISIGGIPIKRNSPREAVIMKNRMKNEEMIIILTPEGTRNATNQWHNGFHSIARGANVPVFIGVLDFKKKVCTLGKEFNISKDFEEDMKQLLNVYNKNQAKFPEKFQHHETKKK